MDLPAFRSGCAAILVAVAAAGCVVLPTSVDVADAAHGTPVFERCSLTPHLPAGVKLEHLGVRATVSIVRSDVTLVRVQFDVPEGSTLVLAEHAIDVDGGDGAAPRTAPIPHVNPVAPARYPETPPIQQLVLPVDTPLRGGRLRAGHASSDRHYWIAAPVAGELGNEVRIGLPEISVNGVPMRFPKIRFTRQLAIGRAPFNC